MTRRELAKRIFEISHIRGTFLLRSGATSDEYFDKYLFEANPAILKEVATALADLVPANVDALAADARSAPIGDFKTGNSK